MVGDIAKKQVTNIWISVEMQSLVLFRGNRAGGSYSLYCLKVSGKGILLDTMPDLGTGVPITSMGQLTTLQCLRVLYNSNGPGWWWCVGRIFIISSFNAMSACYIGFGQ